MSDDVRAREDVGSAELLDLADAMRSLADRATEADGRPALQELVRISIERVPGATWASLTVLRGTHFATEAATDDVAARADALQYELG